MAVETGVAVVVRERRVPVSREVLLVTFVQVSVLVGQVTVCEVSAVSVAVVEGGEGVARCWRRGSDVPVWVAGEVVRILRGGGRVGELGVGNIDVGMVQEEPISTYVLILTTIHPLQMSVKTSVMWGALTVASLRIRVACGPMALSAYRQCHIMMTK